MSRLLCRVRAAQIGAGLLAIAALGPGCGGEDPGSDGSETDSSEEPEPPKPPSFVDLDPLALEVSAASVDDITLAVADLRSTTRVEVDGLSWQPGSGAPALREDDALRIPLGGAMVVGEHELQLVHVVGDEELRSEPLLISIVESAPGVLSASLGPEPRGAGDRLVAHGQGPEAIFGLVDDGAELISIRAGSWSNDGFELSLPGLAPGAGLSAPGLDLSVAVVGDQRWIFVAWLGEGGRVVYGRHQVVDGPGAPQGEPGEVVQLWDLDEPALDASLGPHEHAEIEALTLLGRTVVLGVEARRDIEQPSLGDHLLATRWFTASGEPGAPVILRGFGGAVDLDLPADARAWTYAGHGVLASVRLGLAFPWLLSVATNGLPQLVEDPGEFLSLPSSASSMRSAEGAFGSRHVFALDGGPDDPRAHLLWINRWSEDAEDRDERSEVLSLPAQPSGSPSLALLDGTPTLVMPMGADADALALRSTGASGELVAISELRCDALALASAGYEGVGDTLPLACLVGGELWMGFLSID